MRSQVAPLIKAAISVALLWLLLSRVDLARLVGLAAQASIPWLLAGLVLYGAMVLLSAWRWGVLLEAQGIGLPFRRLTESFLVATFFNNFLPSNIGGDVVRIADTAPNAGSKTVATTVVLLDRGLGLLGLVLIAAIGTTAGPHFGPDGMGPFGPGLLWAGFGLAAIIATPALLMPDGFTKLLQPLRVLHPEWVEERLGRLRSALARFGEAPLALAGCFAGAVGVQAVLVAFYLAVARSMAIPIGFAELAVIVPVSFIVQMAPVSLNGFGVREATFGFYFTRLGLTLESALLVSFMGAALIMMVSLAGGMVYLRRLRSGRRQPFAVRN
ncbi:MAG TPA: lysylphosphatidylglycerol synthase transmembrane domain-containing protein [Vicinamibacterales bacterium]|nr:lysylphosphatidylglycerol synthase transmembrane domain-containing protein [Vicinamibacterales bacterium]